MVGVCSTNGGEEEPVYVIGGKARGKETAGKTNTWMGVILEWILERWDGVSWTGLVWLRIETGGELF
jgi:hypothetical protein